MDAYYNFYIVILITFNFKMIKTRHIMDKKYPYGYSVNE